MICLRRHHFYAEVTARSGSYMPGQVVYMKLIQTNRYGKPMLYSILDPNTGFDTGDEVDANEFKNCFKEVFNDNAKKETAV